MHRIGVYGAGGFGREVEAMLSEIKGILPNDERIFEGFVDDFVSVEKAITLDRVRDVIVAIANPFLRKRIVEKIENRSYHFLPLIHPTVRIHDSNRIGRGSIICSGTKITCDVEIGEFNIINLNVVVGHDVQTGDYCSIMPSANLLGGVTLGDEVFVGAGATIFQNVKVGAGAIVGAGSIVTKDVKPGQKVMGVPARVC